MARTTKTVEVVECDVCETQAVDTPDWKKVPGIGDVCPHCFAAHVDDAAEQIRRAIGVLNKAFYPAIAEKLLKEAGFDVIVTQRGTPEAEPDEPRSRAEDREAGNDVPDEQDIDDETEKINQMERELNNPRFIVKAGPSEDNLNQVGASFDNIGAALVFANRQTDNKVIALYWGDLKVGQSIDAGDGRRIITAAGF